MFVFTHFNKIDIFFSVSSLGSYLFRAIHKYFTYWSCANLYLDNWRAWFPQGNHHEPAKTKGLPRCKNLMWKFSLFCIFFFSRSYCVDVYVSFILCHLEFYRFLQQIKWHRSSSLMSSPSLTLNRTIMICCRQLITVPQHLLWSAFN